MNDTAEPILIPASLLSAMLDHCRRDAPLEACGLLTGIGLHARHIAPLRNAKQSPTRYDADHLDLINAVVSMRQRSEAIVAIYHSHPQWAAIPSQTDLQANYYGDLPRIIVSLLSNPPDVRIYRLEPDRYHELPWTVVPDEIEIDPNTH